VGGEEQLPDQPGGGDQGPQPQRQVGLEHDQRVAEGQAGDGRERSVVWERGQQHRSPGAAALQVALDDEPA